MTSDELRRRIVTEPGVVAGPYPVLRYEPPVQVDRFSTRTLLEESPPWKPRLTLRGLARLPVALS